MNIKHQRISETTKSDVITSEAASLTVSAGNRNCCIAALLDIKWLYWKLQQQSFHNILRSVSLETKQTQKSKSIASNPYVLRKIASSKQTRLSFLGKPSDPRLATLALFDISTD